MMIGTAAAPPATARTASGEAKITPRRVANCMGPPGPRKRFPSVYGREEGYGDGNGVSSSSSDGKPCPPGACVSPYRSPHPGDFLRREGVPPLLPKNLTFPKNHNFARRTTTFPKHHNFSRRIPLPRSRVMRGMRARINGMRPRIDGMERSIDGMRPGIDGMGTASAGTRQVGCNARQVCHAGFDLAWRGGLFGPQRSNSSLSAASRTRRRQSNAGKELIAAAEEDAGIWKKSVDK